MELLTPLAHSYVSGSLQAPEARKSVLAYDTCGIPARCCIVIAAWNRRTASLAKSSFAGSPGGMYDIGSRYGLLSRTQHSDAFARHRMRLALVVKCTLSAHGPARLVR